jgi:DNA-binding MarR family transcriptional regulator
VRTTDVDAGPDFVDEMMVVIKESHQAADVLEAKALAYRIRRIAHRLETEIKRELAPHDIELWELELLACLVRAEPDHRLTAGGLVAQLQLTSGAVTNRVSQLERKGLVSRELDPTDRRSVLVTLTDAGRERALHVFGVKTQTEQNLLGALAPDRQRDVNDALRAILLSLEGPA